MCGFFFLYFKEGMIDLIREIGVYSFDMWTPAENYEPSDANGISDAGFAWQEADV